MTIIRKTLKVYFSTNWIYRGVQELKMGKESESHNEKLKWLLSINKKIIFLFLIKILSKQYIAVGEKLEEKWNMLRLLSSEGERDAN